MALKKEHKVIIGVAVLAVAAYFAWRWWQNRQAANDANSPTGSFGTNLNSVAPELVGGSSGPSVGPAVALPVNITLVEGKGTGSGQVETGRNSMMPAPVGTSANPVFRQTGASMNKKAAGNTDTTTFANSSEEADNTSMKDKGDGTRKGTTHEAAMPVDSGIDDDHGPMEA